MKVDNESLWFFASSMATCLSAGLPLNRALEVSGGKSLSPKLRELVARAAVECGHGKPLSEALAPGAGIFPAYFLPVVLAGESTGRLAEAFQLIEQHSRLVAPSVRLLRNTWLYPLVCILFGWVVRTGVLVYFGKYPAAWSFFCTSFGSAAVIAVVAWAVYRTHLARSLLDSLLLQIPLFRETEIRIATVLFFATFKLAYEAGGVHVTRMFDLAIETVRNRRIREDLLNALLAMEQNRGFGEAFAQTGFLDDDIKGSINSGALVGQLDRSLASIVDTATGELEVTLKTFNSIFQRIVAFSVAMAIVETVMLCVLF